MSPSEVQAFLDRYGLAAHKARGQNFLHDDRLADKLALAAEVGPDDAILEVGTGIGILTRALARRARRVVSVEIDAGLVRGLREEAALPAEVELVHEDALRLDWAATLASDPGPWRVVANLPYSVATPILRRLLDHAHELAGWGVMIQRELALRIGAEVGSRDYGSFAVLHQLMAMPGRRLDLHGRCFHPEPRVVSSFLCLAPRAEGRPDPGELARVETVVRAGFAHRRKTLSNALRRAGGFPAERVAAALEEVGIDPKARAETVEPERWRRLAAALGDGGV